LDLLHKASLRLIYRRMRQRPRVIGDRAKIADINPTATARTLDVIVSSFLSGTAQPLGEILAARN
jgi:hypothetical protein